MTSNFLIQAVMATLCYFDIGYLANMKRENKALANRIQELNQRTGFYQKQMKALVQREVESRIIAGLPEIHPDIRKLGIGGEGPPLYSKHGYRYLDDNNRPNSN